MQTYLDFGQKALGQRTLCSVCGLLYVNGEAEDEKDHANFCRSVSAGLAFQGWKDQRLVWGAEGKDRVIEVRPGDGAPQLLKMGEIKRIMDQEMGFVPLAEGEMVLRPTEKAFVFVHDKRVVGCLVAEKIAAAHPVLQAMPAEEVDEAKEVAVVKDGEEKASQGQAEERQEEEEEEGEEQRPPPAKVPRVEDEQVTSNSSSSSSLASTSKVKALVPPVPLLPSQKLNSNSKGGKKKEEEGLTNLLPQGVAYSLNDKAEATLGIKQIWVSKNSRRKGMARRMVEVARARFYYGFVVPRDKVAFSQLSNMGFSFARAYTEEQETLLVY